MFLNAFPLLPCTTSSAGAMACTATLTGHGDIVISVVFHPTLAATLASASADNTVKLWNIVTGECTTTLTGHREAVLSVVFHPTQAAVLASANSDSTVKLWNIHTGECTATLRGHGDEVYSVVFHPTQPAVLASASEDKTVRLWNMPGLAAGVHEVSLFKNCLFPWKL